MIDTEENKDFVEALGVDLAPCFHFYKGSGTRKEFLAEFDKDNLEAKIIEKMKAVSESEGENQIVNTEPDDQSEITAELINLQPAAKAVSHLITMPEFFAATRESENGKLLVVCFTDPDKAQELAT